MKTLIFVLFLIFCPGIFLWLIPVIMVAGPVIKVIAGFFAVIFGLMALSLLIVIVEAIRLKSWTPINAFCRALEAGLAQPQPRKG